MPFGLKNAQATYLTLEDKHSLNENNEPVTSLRISQYNKEREIKHPLGLDFDRIDRPRRQGKCKKGERIGQSG